MQAQLDLILTQGLDGLLEVNLALVERDFQLSLERVSDRPGGHTAEHLTIITGLHGDGEGHLAEALAQLRHGAEFLGFAVCTTLAQGLDPALVAQGNRHSQSLGDQIVACVAGGDLDQIGLAAQTDHVMNKEDFCLWHVK